MQNLVLSPTDFVALANQTLEHVFGRCQIEGELANFRVSKGKWLYFDIKDDIAKVSCFASVYALPGPLIDGMMIRVSGSPRMHPQFGFSVTVQTITPAGEGSIKKAFELLKAKLTAEGLFEPDRKRFLPYPPKNVALVASVESAAYADFIKIISARWPFVAITVYDTQVQGEAAPAQLASAIASANAVANIADALVVTRGGGSADDLSAFNDERVVRAIAASRIPTVVAIGHEIDESLSELTADLRASTPSNAAELLVPDRASELAQNKLLHAQLAGAIGSYVSVAKQDVHFVKSNIATAVMSVFDRAFSDTTQLKNLFTAYNPNAVLARGYALVRQQNQLLTSVKNIKVGADLAITLKDGAMDVSVTAVHGKLKK